MTECSIDDCHAPKFCRGWCHKHYNRWYETGSTELGVRKRSYKSKPLADRFWPKVQKTETCWLWTGAKTQLGYGTIWIGGGSAGKGMAHRISWELVKGPIPRGMHIDHLCRNTSCVNPDHLEPVTVAENTRRGYAPAIGAAFQRAKSSCPHGHPYDDANTHVNKRGGRMCLTCIRVRQRAQRAAKKLGVPYVDPFSVLPGGDRKSG